MFTGIIEDLGKIIKIEEAKFTIAYKSCEILTLGESISLSGMCSTVIAFNEQEFQVEIMKESRNRTIFKNAKIGDLINLERAAKIGDRNSGHFVLGHIDTTGEIIAREKKSDFGLFRIKISRDFADLIVFKGSIAVDGISLTISDLGEDWFEVSIISHTLKYTNLGQKNIKNLVNLEFDILGKYILRSQELKIK